MKLDFSHDEFLFIGKPTTKSHLVVAGEGSNKTRCGLFLSELRGKWKVVDNEEPTCKRCNDAYFSLNECPLCGRVDGHAHYF